MAKRPEKVTDSGGEPDSCAYRIDREDRIIWVDDAFAAFARQNGAPQLAEGNLLGTRLRDHITDPRTAEIYEAVYAEVRSKRRVVRVPFRCDSPGIRRICELLLHPLPDNGIGLESRVLRRVPRSYVPLLDLARSRSSESVLLCSWCKKLTVAPGLWLDVEEGVRRLGLLVFHPAPELVHGTCPACWGNLLGLAGNSGSQVSA